MRWGKRTLQQSQPRSFRRLAVGAGGLGPVRKLNKISQNIKRLVARRDRGSPGPICDAKRLTLRGHFCRVAIHAGSWAAAERGRPSISLARSDAIIPLPV